MSDVIEHELFDGYFAVWHEEGKVWRIDRDNMHYDCVLDSANRFDSPEAAKIALTEWLAKDAANIAAGGRGLYWLSEREVDANYGGVNVV